MEIIFLWFLIKIFLFRKCFVDIGSWQWNRWMDKMKNKIQLTNGNSTSIRTRTRTNNNNNNGELCKIIQIFHLGRRKIKRFSWWTKKISRKDWPSITITTTICTFAWYKPHTFMHITFLPLLVSLLSSSSTASPLFAININSVSESNNLRHQVNCLNLFTQTHTHTHQYIFYIQIIIISSSSSSSLSSFHIYNLFPTTTQYPIQSYLITNIIHSGILYYHFKCNTIYDSYNNNNNNKQ